MPFVTKSSVSGELNYSSLLLYRKYFERFSLTLCKVKKKIRHVSNLSWDKTSSSFCSSIWTHFQIPFWKISTEPACQRRFSRSHHLRIENACCCLINHRPDCSLINKSHWCIIHFAAIASVCTRTRHVWCTTSCRKVSHHKEISQLNSISSTFKVNKQCFPWHFK